MFVLYDTACWAKAFGCSKLFQCTLLCFLSKTCNRRAMVIKIEEVIEDDGEPYGSMPTVGEPIALGQQAFVSNDSDWQQTTITHGDNTRRGSFSLSFLLSEDLIQWHFGSNDLMVEEPSHSIIIPCESSLDYCDWSRRRRTLKLENISGSHLSTCNWSK